VQSRKSFNHENPSQITMYLSYVGRKSWILANILIRWASSYDKTSLAKISRIQAFLLDIGCRTSDVGCSVNRALGCSG